VPVSSNGTIVVDDDISLSKRNIKHGLRGMLLSLNCLITSYHPELLDCSHFAGQRYTSKRFHSIPV